MSINISLWASYRWTAAYNHSRGITIAIKAKEEGFKVFFLPKQM
jgi:hypothetical protein